MTTEQQFVEKATALTHVLIKTMDENTQEEDFGMSVKISLLALTKAAAGMIYMMKLASSPEDDILELFLSTVTRSVEVLEISTEETEKIIERMMKKL